MLISLKLQFIPFVVYSFHHSCMYMANIELSCPSGVWQKCTAGTHLLQGARHEILTRRSEAGRPLAASST